MLLWSSNYLEWCRFNFNVWVLLGEILPWIPPAIIRPHRCQSRSELRSAREANAGEKEEIERRDRERNTGENFQKIFGNFGWNDLHDLHSFLLHLDNKLWSFALERPDDHRWPKHFWHFCLETMEDLPFFAILNNDTLNWRNHAVQLLVLQFLLQIWYKSHCIQILMEKIFKKTGERVDVVDFLFITMRRPRQEDLQDQPQVTEVERQWLDGTVKKKKPLPARLGGWNLEKGEVYTTKDAYEAYNRIIKIIKMVQLLGKMTILRLSCKSFGTSLFSASNNQFCLQKRIPCYLLH